MTNKQLEDLVKLLYKFAKAYSPNLKTPLAKAVMLLVEEIGQILDQKERDIR